LLLIRQARQRAQNQKERKENRIVARKYQL